MGDSNNMEESVVTTEAASADKKATGSTAKKSTKKKVKSGKIPFFKGLKSEFARVSWPDKESLVKQSAAVVGISVVVGLIITLLDTAIQFGVKFLTM